MSNRNPDTSASNLIATVNGGELDIRLTKALHDAAAAAVSLEKPAKVTLELVFEPIKGTSQVATEYKLGYSRPNNLKGKVAETMADEAVLHVSHKGELSVTQRTLPGVQAGIPA